MIIVSDNKYEIFKRCNYLYENPSKETNEEHCILLDIIVNNGWIKEYFSFIS